MGRKTPRNQIIEECSFVSSEDELTQLATEVRELFPKGINKSTNTLNRQPVKELADALLRFYEYYNLDCTREEIIAATTKYVEDKKFDPYRQCSKYFIIKDLTKEGKGIVSALANYIEMARDGEDSGCVNNSWIDELR